MKSLLKKRNILISAIVILLLVSGIAVTLAYISDRPEQLVNTFEVGNVTTEIIEDNFKQETLTTFSKDPVVVNTGANDCYVRARVVCSPENALELEGISSKWEYKEDEYYYYTEALAGNSNGRTGGKTEPIFTKVIVTDTTIDEFEVTVYQEAVQTIVYASDGTFTTNQDTIWDCYENGFVPNDLNNE